jgi:ABC-2 type transport system ATP-binding protein
VPEVLELTDIAIRTEELSRSFGSVRALEGVTMTVPMGTVFGFLGQNGAGKTTTIHLLLGLLEPSAGRAEVLGHDTRTAAAAIRERSGALLEHAGLYERMSAAENLEFFARVSRMPKAARGARTEELLTSFGLFDRRNDAVGTFSRGMKQKLAIARTMLHRPSLIFLDEPTAGLDPVAAAALREDLLGLAAREKVAIFLTTHNLSEVEKLCGLVAVIRKGRLLAMGHPGELRKRAGGTRVEVTATGLSEAVVTSVQARPDVAHAELRGGGVLVVALKEGEAPGKLVAHLVGHGVDIDEVRKDKASLEDVFLELMSEAAS